MAKAVNVTVSALFANRKVVFVLVIWPFRFSLEGCCVTLAECFSEVKWMIEYSGMMFVV